MVGVAAGVIAGDEDKVGVFSAMGVEILVGETLIRGVLVGGTCAGFWSVLWQPMSRKRAIRQTSKRLIFILILSSHRS